MKCDKISLKTYHNKPKTNVGNTNALVELPKSSPRHRRIISSVHLCDVISFHARYLVHRKISSKRNLSNQLRKFPQQ